MRQGVDQIVDAATHDNRRVLVENNDNGRADIYIDIPKIYADMAYFGQSDTISIPMTSIRLVICSSCF